MPAPDLVTVPVPLMIPEKVWLAEVATSSEPLFVTVFAYVPPPSEPAPPIRRVPRVIVVAAA